MIFGILILNRQGQIRLKKIYNDQLWECISQSIIAPGQETFLQELHKKTLAKLKFQNQEQSIAENSQN